MTMICSSISTQRGCTRILDFVAKFLPEKCWPVPVNAWTVTVSDVCHVPCLSVAGTTVYTGVLKQF